MLLQRLQRTKHSKQCSKEFKDIQRPVEKERELSETNLHRQLTAASKASAGAAGIVCLAGSIRSCGLMLWDFKNIRINLRMLVRFFKNVFLILLPAAVRQNRLPNQFLVLFEIRWKFDTVRPVPWICSWEVQGPFLTVVSYNSPQVVSHGFFGRILQN